MSSDRRDFRGHLDLMVLSVLARGRQYGYFIQDRIREMSGQQIRLSAGTLYPLLHELEDSKVIRSSWDHSSGRPRKWYELTAKGRRLLQSRASAWKAHSACIDRLLDLGLEALGGESMPDTPTG